MPPEIEVILNAGIGGIMDYAELSVETLTEVFGIIIVTALAVPFLLIGFRAIKREWKESMDDSNHVGS